MNLLFLMLTAVLMGRLEAVIYDAGFQPPDNNSLLRYFSLSYHGSLAMLVVALCLYAGAIWAFPAWCLVEDASYFFFARKDSLTDKSWVTGGLGGVRIPGLFIPYTYVGLVVLTLVFNYLINLL